MNTSASHLPRVGLRLPEELKDRVRKLAEINRRSMNAEIIYQLERVVGRPDEVTLQQNVSN